MSLEDKDQAQRGGQGIETQQRANETISQYFDRLEAQNKIMREAHQRIVDEWFGGDDCREISKEALERCK